MSSKRITPTDHQSALSPTVINAERALSSLAEKIVKPR